MTGDDSKADTERKQSPATKGKLFALREELKACAVRETGKPLTPRAVKFVRELPKNRNAKVMRRVIRATFLGGNPGDTSSLEYPGAIRAVREAN